MWLYHKLVKPARSGLRNTVVLQYNRLGAERLLTETSFSLSQIVCLVPSLGYPTSVVISPALPTAHERCGEMGTLGKDGSNPLIFDGRPESWPLFEKALHQLLDKEGHGWVVERVLCVFNMWECHPVATPTDPTVSPS